MSEINLNDTVKVKLTGMGKDIFFHQYDEINKSYGREVIKPSYPKVDENGYTSFQLWNLMEVYGNHVGLGKKLPFETNLIYQEGR